MTHRVSLLSDRMLILRRICKLWTPNDSLEWRVDNAHCPTRIGTPRYKIYQTPCSFFQHPIYRQNSGRNPHSIFIFSSYGTAMSPAPITLLNLTLQRNSSTGGTNQAIRKAEESSLGWIAIVLIVVTVTLQLRHNLIWSDARILRKINYILKSQTSRSIAKQIRDGLDEEIDGPRTSVSSTLIFARLYERLSKGRHRFVGRLFSNLAKLSLWGLQVVETFEEPYLQMLNSDVLISFYLLLGVGSITVLGAFRPNKVEGILIICSILLATTVSIVLRATVHDTSPESNYDIAVTAFAYLRYVCVLLGVLVAAYDLFVSITKREAHISNIVSCILHQDRMTKSHVERLEAMRAAVESGRSEYYETKSNWKWRGNRNFKFWFDVVLFLGTSVEGALYSVLLSTELLPAFFALETSSYMFFLLLLINDNYIENELLFKLVKISEEPIDVDVVGGKSNGTNDMLGTFH